MIHRYLILSLLAFASLANAGSVFWTDRGASQIKRMSFDGSDLVVIPLSGATNSPGGNLRGIAVNTAQNQIFWADNGMDRLLRANMDGSATTILHAITGGNPFPADVRLDIENQFFYWCDQQRNRIQRSSLSGASVTNIITNAAPTGPYFMDIDAPSGKIYWGDFGGGSIYRANLDGSARETLLTGNNDTRGVCLDRGEGMLYWINRNDSKVHRCPLSAFAGGTIPLTHPAVQTLYTNLDTPHGLVLDIPARKLYWADTGTNQKLGSQGARSVSRGDFDGSTPLEILATGTEPWDVDLDRRCQNYSEWRKRCFRRDAPAEQTDPHRDPDGDAIPNSLEYAFNLPPMGAGREGIPEGFISIEASGSYPSLRFRRRTGGSDLTYYVQVSTALGTWSGSPTEPTTTTVGTRSLGDDMEEVIVRTLDPILPDATLFIRLRVQLNP